MLSFAFVQKIRVYGSFNIRLFLIGLLLQIFSLVIWAQYSFIVSYADPAVGVGKTVLV